jgi:primosomal protein N' (replication factor Y)
VENTGPQVAKRTVKVLLPLPLADAYDYSVPEGLEVAAGHFAIVPLGKRETVGVVWGEGSGEVPAAKLRDIVAILPALPMADSLRRFVDWVSAYTLAPPGAVLRVEVPQGHRIVEGPAAAGTLALDSRGRGAFTLEVSW